MSTILVVEDDQDLRNLLAIILDAEGYSVKEAEHGLEAWNICLRTPLPDLIILDIDMPVLDGWEFLDRRGRNPDLLAVPTLICTATDARQRSQAYPGVQVLRKPFFAGQLVRMTQRALSKTTP